MLGYLQVGEPSYELLYIAADRFLRVLLYFDCVSSPTILRTTCANMAASSRAFGRASARSDYINDILTRITLVGAIYLISDLADSAVADWRHSLQSSLASSAASFERLPAWVTNGLGVNFLLRRHVAADRGRCCDGYSESDRVATHHAALRGLYAAQAGASADAGPGEGERAGGRSLRPRRSISQSCILKRRDPSCCSVLRARVRERRPSD